MWRWVLVAIIAGCAPAPPPPPPLGDAGLQPSLEVESAAVDVGGAALRFGEVAHRAGTIALRLRGGASTLAVNATVTSPGCLGLECVASLELTLEPEVWLRVPVAIDLSRPGEVRAVVTFTAPGLPALPVVVLGTGSAAPDCLEVSASSINFGTLNQGCPVAQRPLQITNSCLVPRLLNGAELVPLQEPFVLSALTSLPRRLAPGESWSGLAEFVGGLPGPHEALLEFRVDAEIAAAVGLTGNRGNTTPREFSFSVLPPLLDLLVVLDSSPSFVPRRSGVESQLVSGLTDLSWYAGPLRVGVLATGGADLVEGNGQRFFENSEVGFAANLRASLAAVPSTGDEIERCLETATQVPPTFWRPGSRRRAMCLTDAAEQSANPMAAVAMLADSGVRWDVVGPPLSPPDGGCQVEAFDDGGHLAAAAALSGTVVSICSASWRLPAVPPAPPPPTRFSLPETPAFPLAVFVDGALLAESEWTWEAATRTLVLRNAPTNALVIRESPSCTQ